MRCSPAWIAALAVTMLGGAACTGEPAVTPDSADVGTDAADVADDAVDATDTGSDAVAGTLKWTARTPPIEGKVLAAAAVPGAVGSYLLAGEGGKVVALQGDAVTAIDVPGVGTGALQAVWVASDGTAYVGGAASVLAYGKGSDWQLVGEIPPSPAMRFRAIAGAGDVVWAVGDDGRAFRKQGDGLFLPVGVTVTAGEGIGAGANFIAVAVADGTTWVAADKGASAAGVVIAISAGTSVGYPLAVAPRAMWRSDDGGVWVAGGTVEAYVARLQGDAFVAESGLQWSLGFSALGGRGDSVVFAGALKGQVRRFDGKAWSVVAVAAPPGTPKPFAQPSGDVGALAVHNADELLVVTPFVVYRYGVQP